MAKKEIKSFVERQGSKLTIPLPTDFCIKNNIHDGTEILVAQTMPNVFEFRVIGQKSEKIKCEICGKSTAKYTCTLCATFACPNCFWELGKLCKKCMKKKK